MSGFAANLRAVVLPRRYSGYAGLLLAAILAAVVWQASVRLSTPAAPPFDAPARNPDLVEIAALKHRLKTSVGDVEARQRLGSLELRRGNAVSAEHHLRKALELGAEPAGLVGPLAKALLLRREYERLLAETDAKAGFPGSVLAELMSLRGQAALALGRRAEGRAAIREAAALDPDALEVRLGLFHLYRDEGALSAAQAELRRAVAIHGESAETAWLGGWLALEQARYEEALEHFQRVTELTPEGWLTAWSRSALLGQAEALLLEGRLAEARHQVDRLLAIDGDDPSANYLAAVIASQGGEVDVARQRLLRVANLGSRHPAAPVLLAVIEQARGNLEHAAAHLNRHVAANPFDLGARDLLLALLVRLNDLPAAARVLARAPAPVRERPVFRAWQGWMALREGRLREAAAHFEAARGAAPGDARLGRFARLVGQLADPARPLAALAEEAPAGCDTLCEAIDRLRQGHAKSALELTTTALARRDAQPELALLLAVLHQREGRTVAVREDAEAGLILWARLEDRAPRGGGVDGRSSVQRHVAEEIRPDDATSFFYLVDWRSYVARFELKPDVQPTMFDEGPVFGWAAESGLSQPPPVSFERRRVEEAQPEINPRKPTQPASVPPIAVLVFMALLILQRVASRAKG